MTYSLRMKAALAACAALLLAASITMMLPARAASPYHIVFSTSNFNLRTLSAAADDLSNPGHILFSLQNGTQFWYGITVQSTPAGIAVTPARANDLESATFTGAIPLVPPMGVLPFDQGTSSLRYDILRLAVAFSGPAQQVQLQLNPYESHAVTLDVLTMLLQVLGFKSAGGEIGLLAPNGLTSLFADAGSLSDLTTLVGDYTQVLQSQTDQSSTLTAAFACANDVVSLLTTASEQPVLADILWKLVGKTIPYAVILKTVVNLTEAQFGLGLESFISSESSLMSTLLFQQENPVVVIQSVSNAAPTGPTTTLTPTQSLTATPSLPAISPSPSPHQ